MMHCALNSTSTQPNESNEKISSQPTTTVDTVHRWDGGLHLVPQDFDFPQVSVQEMWRIWINGDAHRSYPPLRRLIPNDMPSKKLRKRLSDLRYLMKRIESAAVALGINVHNLTPRSSRRAFESCKDAVHVADVTNDGRRRRKQELVWVSIVRILRLQNS